MITSQIIGNIVRDPEVHTFGTTMVTNFTVASQNRLEKGQERPEATFINCKFFGQAGETFAKFFSKGDKVFVSGELFERKWSTSEKEGKSLDMVCNNWTFVGEPKVKEVPEPEVVPKQSTTTSAPKTTINKAQAEIEEFNPFEDE